jgi:hypothetical protein
VSVSELLLANACTSKIDAPPASIMQGSRDACCRRVLTKALYLIVP